MAYVAYTPEWAEAFKTQINTSDHYKQVAATWEGTVSLVVLAEPDKHVDTPSGVWMDLWHGEARDVHICTTEEAQQAEYVLTGSYSRWKQIANKQLDPIKAMILGQLKLKGNFPKLVRYTSAAQELVECTTRVEVSWPDEVAEPTA